MADGKLLEVNDLKVYFYIEQGIVRAVDGVSFDLKRGQTLGVVGESGCGKSVTALTLILLHPQPEGNIAGGRIFYYKNGVDSIDITKMDLRGDEIRGIRGNEIAMVFQEPMTSLNPVYTVGEQLMEAIQLHRKVKKAQARELAIDMLDRVRMSAPEQRVDEYPHQLSGGMRQRVMIAMALSCNPALLIADEPTTALDVTIEAQILSLIKDIQQEDRMSLMIITHDLGVIGEMSDHVIVMYMGKVVEKAITRDIFESPKHPYTYGLLKSLPKIGSKTRLLSISGSVPNPWMVLTGCSFEQRCPVVMDICKKNEPPVFNVEKGHYVKCWVFKDDGDAV
ncbi:MAG TPA: ABC transporter ATP-binding protein [Spirochaetes bacterium]|nr:ABC transporter ATP-binding protein [Spirochaetota bacterium]